MYFEHPFSYFLLILDDLPFFQADHLPESLLDLPLQPLILFLVLVYQTAHFLLQLEELLHCLRVQQLLIFQERRPELLTEPFTLLLGAFSILLPFQYRGWHGLHQNGLGRMLVFIPFGFREGKNHAVEIDHDWDD